jgi:biopolymer transport protein ExbD
MPVHKPHRRLLNFIPLAFVQKKVGGGGQRPVVAGLSLTSMIDFLVVTVVFLLMSFSASGEFTTSKDVQLPKAENVMDMLDAPVVAVAGPTGRYQILVDGSTAGYGTSVIEADRLQIIEELRTILKQKREMWISIKGKETPFPGVVVLTIDQNVPALLVKSVFQTAALSGYPNVSFMVDTLPHAK